MVQPVLDRAVQPVGTSILRFENRPSRGKWPIQICHRVVTIFLALFLLGIPLQAETWLFPADAVFDMDKMKRSELFEKHKPQKLSGKNLPGDQGLYVVYRHKQLSYLMGPFESEKAAGEGYKYFENIRQALISKDAKFIDSVVAVATARSDLPSGEVTQLAPFDTAKFEGVDPEGELAEGEKSDGELAGTEGEEPLTRDLPPGFREAGEPLPEGADSPEEAAEMAGIKKRPVREQKGRVGEEKTSPSSEQKGDPSESENSESAETSESQPGQQPPEGEESSRSESQAADESEAERVKQIQEEAAAAREAEARNPAAAAGQKPPSPSNEKAAKPAGSESQHPDRSKSDSPSENTESPASAENASSSENSSSSESSNPSESSSESSGGQGQPPPPDMLPQTRAEQRAPEGGGGGMQPATPAELAKVPLAWAPFFGEPLPQRVDLSRKFPSPGQQEAQNSCVGWALGYGLKTYQEQREEGWKLTGFLGMTSRKNHYSPSYIYNQLNGGKNDGVRMIDGLQLMTTNGVCKWSLMPYRPSDLTHQPKSSAISNGRRFVIDQYRRVIHTSLEDLKAHLAAGYPIPIGILADDSFKKHQGSGNWNGVTGKGYGHAVILTGYDDGRQAFRVMNSHGKKWGDKGYFWMAYSALASSLLEAYVVKDAVNDRDTRLRSLKRSQAPGGRLIDLKVDISHATRDETSGAVRLHGVFGMPAGRVGTAQVVVHFFSRGKTPFLPIGSSVEEMQTVNGQLAIPSKRFAIRFEGTEESWKIEVPGDALKNALEDHKASALGKQQQEVVAIPVLYLNQFGLAEGKSFDKVARF